MQYFQNTGTAFDPQFSAPVTNPFGLVSTFYNAFPAFADLDAGGDPDLLVGEYYGVMQYFENLEIVIGIADVSPSFDLKIYPNPVTNVLKIESDESISKIEVFNTLGDHVYMVEDQVNQIPLHYLFPGVYMVKVTSVKGNFITRKIQKL